MACELYLNKNLTFKQNKTKKISKQKNLLPKNQQSKISAGNLKGIAKILTLLKFLRQLFILGIIENF